MSWVLILTSHETGRPPAVIGGYSTRESAEVAGELATRPIKAEPSAALDWDQYPICYQKFTVIPGAAVDGPLGCTHSELWRDDSQKLIRKTYRYTDGDKQ